MKSVLLGCLTAMTIGLTAASAQSTNGAANPTPAPAPAATPAMTAPAPAPAMATNSASAGGFITTQQAGMLRAPKLVGVAVYDSENKDVGKISDLLLDHDGSVKAVVISIGGFLGIGSKEVAVPYSDVHWQTEQRTSARDSATAPASAPAGATKNTALAEKSVSVEKTEAYQGYPDRAVINMSQADLKAAPEFKYASNPEQVANPGAPATDAAPAPVKP